MNIFKLGSFEVTNTSELDIDAVSCSLVNAWWFFFFIQQSDKLTKFSESLTSQALQHLRIK